MAQGGAANAFPVVCTDAAQQGRLSFLGATIEDPQFRPHVESPHVDLQREYAYPQQHQWLSGFGLLLVAAFWLCYLFGSDIIKMGGANEQLNLLVGLAFLGTCCGGAFYGFIHAIFYLQSPASPGQPLSRREFRHVIGTTGCAASTWAYIALGLCMSILLDRIHNTGVFYLFGFFCVCITSVVQVGSAWLLAKFCTHSAPVKCGFVVSMLWSGGIFSIFCAGTINSFELLVLWPVLSPTCNIGQDMGMAKGFMSRSDSCTTTKWVQWILTAGLNEEVLKFACLARLRASVADVVHSCWLTRCLRSSNTPIPCCAWLLKLAPSPMAVVLAGMAAGAGFASLENVSYVEKIQKYWLPCMEAYGDDYMRGCEDISTQIFGWQVSGFWMAAIRIQSASIHISMTGTCACALAHEMFIQPKHWWLKYVACMAMAVLHGSFNASTDTKYGWKDSMITTDMIGAFINTQFAVWFLVALLYMERNYERNVTLRNEQAIVNLGSPETELRTGAGEPIVIDFQVPAGCAEGSEVLIAHPVTGAQMKVTVPQGLTAGMVFQVSLASV